MDSCYHEKEAQLRRANQVEEEQELGRAAETARCLLLFSRAISGAAAAAAAAAAPLPLKGGSYECKTCNRRFSSFQALGGHRASHKRPRFAGEDGGDVDSDDQQPHKQRRGKARGHECAICGLEFAIGQALGGHMRRHRNEAIELTLGAPTAETTKKAAKKARFFDLNLPPLEDYPTTFILA
ncbi:zinc finger protein ZAT12-like [Nymphaea colorata]|nr:zinc finger protein ZAT12-like [Nymphaea colorata]